MSKKIVIDINRSEDVRLTRYYSCRVDFDEVLEMVEEYNDKLVDKSKAFKVEDFTLEHFKFAVGQESNISVEEGDLIDEMNEIHSYGNYTYHESLSGYITEAINDMIWDCDFDESDCDSDGWEDEFEYTEEDVED